MTLADSLSIFELTNLNGQDEQTLKKIYYRLAQKYHPDRGGSFEQFIKLREAYSYLKNAVQDPGFADREQGSSAYNSSSGFDESQSTSQTGSSAGYDYQSLLNQLNSYKAAYEKARGAVTRYENIFNAQIRAVNSTNAKLKKLFDIYDTQRQQLESILNQHLDNLKKQYERTWWQYILPVKKLTHEQYIQRNNSLIREFNAAIQKVDDQMLSDLIKLYQGNLKEIMDLLEF